MPTIREMREKLNISQEELARQAGLGYQTISRMEAGQPVRRNNVARVCQALGISLAEIEGITFSSAVRPQRRRVS